MRYELWHSESESSYMLLYVGDRSNDHVKPSDARVVWTTEAETYEQAIQNKYDYLGWGQYKPLDGVLFDHPPEHLR